MTGKVTDVAGNDIQGCDINTKLRHTMVRKLFATTCITSEQKKECFAQLAKIDQSDMIGRTEVYCQAASPDKQSKYESFLTIFERSDEMSLQHVQEMCRGFR